MIRPPFGLALGVALTATAGIARADPPQVNATSPFGVRRGESAEVTIAGANLAGHPRLAAPFAFEAGAGSSTVENAGAWTFRLTVAPTVAVGVYPIRVVTDDGISNPILFAVGQVPQVVEAEDNNRVETAQAVPSPVVVEGQAAGSDVDVFRFPGRKGQRIVVDAQCARIGSGIDPTIRLTTARGAVLASADDSPGLMTDARLTAVLSEDGEYLVELSDTRYQGGSRPVYRLLIGPVPVADEVYPIGGRRAEPLALEFRGGTLAEPRTETVPLDAPPDAALFRPRVSGQAHGFSETPMEIEGVAPLAVSDLPEVREPADPSAPPARGEAPAVFNGRIDPAGDEDRFLVALSPGKAYRARVLAWSFGSALDGQLQVLGANGAVLATGDDTNLTPAAQGAAAPVSPDPSVDFTPPGDVKEVALVLRDLVGRGGVGYPYRIVVEPIVPSFDLRLAEAQVNVPRGGAVSVPLTVARQGYNGPISLSVASPPPGLAVRSGTIREGQAAGALTLSAPGDAAFGPVELKVVGEGAGPNGPIVRVATKVIAFSQQGNNQQGIVPTQSRTFSALAAAPSQPGPIGLDAPEGPIEVVHGQPETIPLTVRREPGADGPLAVAIAPQPPGISLLEAAIPEKSSLATVTLIAAPDAPLGRTTLAMTAKGKVTGKDRTFAVPLVTIDVVRPASVELAAPAVEVRAGESVEVRGKLLRRGPFHEPVTVRLDGLPPGLKADPATLPPDTGDFTLNLVASDDASPTAAEARVAIAFQLKKKDYLTPTLPLSVKILPKQAID